MKIKPLSGILLLSFLLLSSCLGINADIVLNQNGSGYITLEYRISKSLDSLGKLDGNERWNTIPVGESDFERTLDRLPDMKLLSFSSAENGKNLIVSAKMEFSTINGLLAFLDASGGKSSFTGDARSGRLVLTLNEAKQTQNTDLSKLIKDISIGYYCKMSMSFPGEGNLVISDKQGKSLASIPESEIRDRGKKVSCTLPVFEILNAAEGMNVVFQW